MGNIIPFNQVTKGDLAALQGAFEPENSMVVSSGFPVLSIKGSKWAIVRNGDREVIRKPGSDEPAFSLELCVIDYNRHVSKTYYEGSYEEGSQDKPTCYSNNGEAPAQDAEVPQAKKCATCPHNQWGSRITESGKKAKSCSDFRRLAVASPTQLNDPMLLRVPPTSLAPLGEYQAMLSKRNLGVEAVVTKIAFDPDASSPLLTFTPVGLITGDMVAEIKRMKGETVVQQIIGTVDMPNVVDPKGTAEEEAEEEDDAPPAATKPRTTKKATAKAAQSKAKPKPEPEPEPEAAGGFDDDDNDLFAALDDMLGG